VYREVWPNSNQFSLIGETVVKIITLGVQKIQLSDADNATIHYETGDRLGFRLDGAQAAGVPFDVAGDSYVSIHAQLQTGL
jgi:hypothetical protein